MRILSYAALGAGLFLLGCSHLNESSATATGEQIIAHLKTQLHCETLNLVADGANAFNGTGKGAAGEFTLTVTRQGNTILYHGEYTNGTHGSFNGSSSWRRTATAWGFYHRTKNSENNTHTTQSPPP